MPRRVERNNPEDIGKKVACVQHYLDETNLCPPPYEARVIATDVNIKAICLNPNCHIGFRRIEQTTRFGYQVVIACSPVPYWPPESKEHADMKS